MERMLWKVDAEIKKKLADKAQEKIPERTGAMLGSFISQLYASSIMKGLSLGSGVGYARYVNEFVPPINWTKGGSWYKWHDKMIRYAVNQLKRILKQKIVEEGFQTAAGMSAAGVANQFGVSM